MARGVLAAEQELDRAVLRGLEAGRVAERRTERVVLRRRQRLEHRPLLEELLLDELDAREDLEARLERDRRARSAIAALSSWIMSFIHSSDTWCWTMNSISSCRGGAPSAPESGTCADSRRSSCR